VQTYFLVQENTVYLLEFKEIGKKNRNSSKLEENLTILGRKNKTKKPNRDFAFGVRKTNIILLCVCRKLKVLLFVNQIQIHS